MFSKAATIHETLKDSRNKWVSLIIAVTFERGVTYEERKLLCDVLLVAIVRGYPSGWKVGSNKRRGGIGTEKIFFIAKGETGLRLSNVMKHRRVFNLRSLRLRLYEFPSLRVGAE